MKKIWLIANWKSNFDLKQSLEWLSIVGPKIPKVENLKVVVCPDFLSIEEMSKDIKTGNLNLLLGSQDLSPFPAGAYTGEENIDQLKMFVSLAILGHSERRKNFKESDEQINQKVEQAKMGGIIPLVCIQGEETLVPDGCMLVAYEPVFAIGSGQADTPGNADKVAKTIKQKYGEEVEVLYGGSVTSENIKSFLEMENISGCLVGKASLDAEEFLKMIEICDGI